MNLITCDDGWVINLDLCAYLHPENYRDGKDTPMIKYKMSTGDILTSTFDSFQERDIMLHNIREKSIL